jgi:hypothetical protein
MAGVADPELDLLPGDTDAAAGDVGLRVRKRSLSQIN